MEEEKQGNYRKLQETEALTPGAPANIKHIPATSQMNIKPHTDGLFTSFSITLRKE